MLPALLAQKGAKGRDELVLQTSRGKTALVLRAGPWKLIARDDSQPQLYNLESDLKETRDLASAQPDRVATMLARLIALRDGVSASNPVERSGIRKP